MEDMGYTNMEVVIRNVSSKGLLVKDTKSRASGHSGEVIGTLDSYKLSLLFYLAHVTKNMDAASDDPSEIPPRYYFGGYGNITEDFGVTQPTKTVAQQIFAGERDLDGYVESRYGPVGLVHGWNTRCRYGVPECSLPFTPCSLHAPETCSTAFPTAWRQSHHNTTGTLRKHAGNRSGRRFRGLYPKFV